MKKIISLFSLQLLFIVGLYAQPVVRITKNDAASTIVEIQFNPNITSITIAQALQIPGCTPWQQKGAPDLPKYTFSLQIPDLANTTTTILSQSASYINDVDVQPSKGKLSRLQDPATIPFIEGGVYNVNDYYPASITNASQPFIQRDVRGQTWQVSPYQYNPITKQLKVNIYLKLEIKYNGTNGINSLIRNPLANKINETFYQLYKNQFINYEFTAKKNTRYAPIVENDNLLIYCPNKYLTTIQPFVEWKKQKGIYTTVVDVDNLPGMDLQAEIFADIKNKYTGQLGTSQVSHVLMIGNDADIPVMEDGNATLFSLGSDNPYGYMLGNDHRAEIIVGRFSGANANQIAAQVSKSIAYEKTPLVNGTSTDWFNTQVSVASNASTRGDDNQLDFEHERQIADSNINNGPYKQKLELFDGAHGGADDPTDPQNTDIIKAINNGNGVGLINYTGHGYYDRLVTTGFKITDVDSLTNTNGNWPFMLVVGCSPGDFINSNECLAEKLSYATMNNVASKPVGTIINAMSTVAQWWNEPMEVQDEFNALLRGARPFAIKHTFGGMMVNAFGSMMDKYNIYNGTTFIDSGGNQMTDTWQIFGDPTLVVRTGNWGTINCSNFSVLPNLGTTFSMNCNANGADVCLYQNGEILATTKVVNNIASFSFAPVDISKLIHLTATKYNNIPLVGYVYNPVQIKQQALLNTITVLPNPIANDVTISSPSAISSIEIINTQGAIVQATSCNGSKQYNLKLSNIASGVYYCKVITANGIVVKKVVKQ
jgi:gingipain R